MKVSHQFFIAEIRDGTPIIYHIAHSPATALAKRQEAVKKGVEDPRILRQVDGQYVDITEGVRDRE